MVIMVIEGIISIFFMFLLFTHLSNLLKGKDMYGYRTDRVVFLGILLTLVLSIRQFLSYLQDLQILEKTWEYHFFGAKIVFTPNIENLAMIFTGGILLATGIIILMSMRKANARRA